MSRLTLIRLSPRNPATGAAEAVRLAGGGGTRPYHHGGLHYRAGLLKEPRFAGALAFGADGWRGGGVPTVTAINFTPADPALLDQLHQLYWPDAAIEMDSVDDADGVTRVLTGTVASVIEQDGVLSITAADLSQALAKPLATGTFAGTGGIEGDTVATGRVKRRSRGRVFNVEGRLLLAAWNIYEFGDPARPLQGCTALRDKGREGYLDILGWQGSIAATLDALKAAVAPQGGGVFAPSIACAKWWTQPAGPLTADLLGEIGGGYVETVAEIAAAVSAALDGPAVSNLAAAIALRPAAAGWHVGDASTTGAAVLDQMLAGAGLFWVLDPAGAIRIAEWTWDGPAEAVRGIWQGRDAQYAPHKSRKVGFRKNERQHGDGEIAADILASEVTYEDGTPIEELKPAERDATEGAPAGTPVGNAEAQAVVDGLVRSALTVAEEALRQGTYRIETDEILKFAGGSTMRQLVEQLGMTVGGVTTFVDFLRSVDSAGNAIWALTAQNSNGAVTGIKNLLTGEGLGKLTIAADILEAVDPDGGDPKFIFRYGLDNRLILNDVYVEKLEAGAIDFEFMGNRHDVSTGSMHQGLPGGLVMKGGRYRGTIAEGAPLSLVFPEPFEQFCIGFIPVPWLASPSTGDDCWLQNVGNPTRFGASVQVQRSTGSGGSTLDGFDWWAFGK